ncbi:MAG: hypothetical protein U0236_11930 [Nitrospira sp.]
MNDAEQALRALWTRMGVDPARQDDILADNDRKADPAYLATLFPSSAYEGKKGVGR